MKALLDKAHYYDTSVAQNQEPLDHPLTLYEAMARALKYNWDYRVKIQEANLRKVQLQASSYDMLPEIATNAGYTARNNTQASNSLNLLSGDTGDDLSTSRDKHMKSADISFGWNILDFGLSYIRSRQLGDRYLISQELRRKVMHQLLDDVRKTYWQALAYQRLYDNLKKIESRLERAQRNSRQISRSGQTPRLQALTSERELLEIKRSINMLQEDIRTAKTKLAALINIRPQNDIELAAMPHKALPKKLPVSLDEMMTIALRDRPELHEKLYQMRINQQEAKASLLKLLPGLNVYAGENWDSNSYLLNANWIDWGAAASWNLLQVFQYPVQKRQIEEQTKLLSMQTMALSMSIMTQVQMSKIRYIQTWNSYNIAKDYLNVQNRLIRQYRLESRARRVSEQKLLREELNTLVAQTKYDLTYAELQSAFSQIFTSMGWEPCPDSITENSIEDIAYTLKASWENAEYNRAAFTKNLPEHTSKSEDVPQEQEKAK